MKLGSVQKKWVRLLFNSNATQSEPLNQFQGLLCHWGMEVSTLKQDLAIELTRALKPSFLEVNT